VITILIKQMHCTLTVCSCMWKEWFRSSDRKSYFNY